jgi:uncharacterized surface protein with fasciclin (FAS1) repeats
MNIKQINHFLAVGSVGCAIGAALAACSDWDDHYAPDAQVLSTQGASLWQNIASDGRLNEFATLLRQTGYDKVLDAPQAYTVWAPEDGTFDYATLQTTADDKLKREFIQNHIARSLYPASGNVSERVLMLNNKKMDFAGSGSYTMQDIAVSRANIAAGNGTLHTISGKIPYKANIYESLNNETFDIDSISDFYHRYDVRVLNIEKSVQGPTVDGEITYLDSIMEHDNSLYRLFYSYINREDSSYTMLVPDNSAWHKAKQAISQYYNYLPTFENNDSVAATSKGRIKRVDINADYLRDSLVTLNLLRDLFFNNNMYGNKPLKDLAQGQTVRCDSLCTTTQSKFFATDAARLFDGATRVEKSNGAIWVTDSLRTPHWISWCPELRQEAETSSLQAGVFNGSVSATYVSAGQQNPNVPGTLSNGRYIEVLPASSSSNPEVAFYLRGVRSTTYVAYLVTVPANIVNANRAAKPNRLICTVCYTDAKGKLQETRIMNPVDRGTNFITDTTRVDTLCLGEVTFPVAYAGLGSSSQPVYPYLRVRSSVNNALSATHDRTLRFDCLILRPKALDDYLKEHPDYIYDRNN